jgi:hypothetical protein
MAQNKLSFDKDKFFSGMEQLNKEKSEIKLLLKFCLQSLRDISEPIIAQREKEQVLSKFPKALARSCSM